jgi:hypothetical protein
VHDDQPECGRHQTDADGDDEHAKGAGPTGHLSDIDIPRSSLEEHQL